MTTEMEPPRTKGLVLHSEARYYDLLAWLLTFGRERSFRARLTELAGLREGERVLDVGCGTGTLAIAAKQHVGKSGVVVGIDASPAMIERAKRKADTVGVDVSFQTAIVEALPFPDASFDVVFNTLMLHHLPRPAREQCAREMRRVLRPGGRVLAVDFATSTSESKGLLSRLHRHGGFALRDIVQLLTEAGLRPKEVGALRVSDLQFILAAAPEPNEHREAVPLPPVTRSLAPLPAASWMWLTLAIVIVAAHAILIRGTFALAASTLVLAAVMAATVILHFGGVGALHAVLRHRNRR